MSADKHRSADRQRALLERAAEGDGIPCHCEGGMAMKNRDLRRLLRRGQIVFRRRVTFSLFGEHIRRTYAVATEAGRRALTAR